MLNRVDGRTQERHISPLKDNYGVCYADLIAFHDFGGKLYQYIYDAVKFIMQSLALSIEKHSPVAIFIAAHTDCVKNPISDQELKRQLKKTEMLFKK